MQVKDYVEYQYLIKKSDFSQIKQIIKKQMQLEKRSNDEAKYQIIDYYMIKEGEDLVKNEKIRLRIHPDDQSHPAYLEIKRNYLNAISQQKIDFPLTNVIDLIDFKSSNSRPKYSYLKSAMTYLLKQYNYKMTDVLRFTRLKYFSTSDSQFKVTFDFHMEKNEEVANEEIIIMKVKIKNKIDLWLVELLSKIKENNLREKTNILRKPQIMTNKKEQK